MNDSKKNDCCSDEQCDSGRRNHFYDKKCNTNDSWQVEQDYQQQRRRLINRAVLGWGVVYGYSIALSDDERCAGDSGSLLVGAGFALDECGHELVQMRNHRLAVTDCLVFGGDGKKLESPAAWTPKDLEGRRLLLSAHYAERLVSPVVLKDPCQSERQAWNEVCETVRYSLTLIDCKACCRQPCELNCECARDDRHDDEGGKDDAHGNSACCPPGEHQATPRGGCSCLCEHLIAFDPTPDCCAPKAISKTLSIALHHGVALACVGLAWDEKCKSWSFAAPIDACGPRRLVKRNDLLFDLVRGCDLTHIARVSWADWHRNPNGETVPFEAFKAKFGQPNAEGENVTDFRVEFSRPVDVATLGLDAFAMTIVATDDREGWGQTLRVPIVGIELDEAQKQPGHATRATLVVDADWADSAFDRHSVFAHPTRVEIEIRGDYLLDCNGQPVDANARGLQAAPSGNGTPGGTYFSTFQLAGKVAQPADRAYSRKGNQP